MSIIASQYITGRKIIIRVHPIVYKDANIRSVYNICTMGPAEELTVALASIYTVSVLVKELVASPPTAVTFLATILNPTEIAALASAYSLSTAVTP